MSNVKLLFALIITISIFLSCSIVNRIKERITSEKEGVNIKEEIEEGNSKEDMDFYNKYIEVLNKVQDAGENVNKDYNSSIPRPESITKNTLIIPVSLSISVGSLERIIKELKRSYHDGGELSKLDASEEMQNQIENDFESLLTSMEQYYPVAQKVSDYYSKGEFKKDLSNVGSYDEEMKDRYGKYKTELRKFSATIKKYKPQRVIRDPASISDPDERASTVMLNAYGNILDAAEEFYERFEELDYNEDLVETKRRFDEFENKFNENKQSVLSAEFTETTKFMKYNFEDYFSKMTNNFLDAGKKFFENAPDAKNQNEFDREYNDVINNYNYMINSYNTSIYSINMIRRWGN